MKRSGLQPIVERQPFDLPSQNHLGWCYYFAGDYQRAIEQHRKVLELDPMHGQTRLLLGRALVQRELFGEALEQLRKNEMSPARTSGSGLRTCCDPGRRRWPIWRRRPGNAPAGW